MRKTKIVCTLGPSTDREGVLREMIRAGMNVARFNFSHGTHAEHKARLDALKALREELDAPVAAMLDTKGPEVRLKDFAGGGHFLYLRYKSSYPDYESWCKTDSEDNIPAHLQLLSQ